MPIPSRHDGARPRKDEALRRFLRSEYGTGDVAWILADVRPVGTHESGTWVRFRKAVARIAARSAGARVAAPNPGPPEDVAACCAGAA